MDRTVMLTTRWIRLATLIAFIVFLLFLDGVVPLICIGIAVIFIGVTGWQLWKLYTDERYLS
ncbi:hypothetical protein [Corynebacterium terpenotabidum]|uniref:Uncharacterized protein n=1 Tax=Corynebacterium terpenotabidum Y-11 TaxID=1200352 RepID=S4XC90_9CORY|nr:hypothetical protein [Corynebacterium terpenotabidum]AGP30737.1 hypothetical protein A606_05450 [Corynebacterium terpenotabidum Y-11]